MSTSKRPSVFGYAWRGFRLLRRRRKLTIAGAARAAGVRSESVNYSENRHGNVDFVVADRLLRAYGASIVDLGLMTQLAEQHLAALGRDSLHEMMMPAIMAEFEQRRGQASPLLVPMPDPLGLLREIDRRIAPIERLSGKASAVSKRCGALCRPWPATWAPSGTRGARKESQPLNFPGGSAARTRRRIGEVRVRGRAGRR